MRSHRNLHHLLGIEHSEVMPHPMLMGYAGHGIRPMGEGLAPHHAHIVALGMGLGYGLTAGGGSSGGGGDIGGSGLYATPHGGKLSKIGQAFNKAFNPQKNGVAKAVEHNIVQPVQHDLITPAIKVGDQIKTGVVKTYNQAKSGFNQTFTPQVGKDIVQDLKVVGNRAIPYTLGALSALAVGTATGGNPALAGAAGIAGGIAGNQINKSLGIENDKYLVGVKKIKGTGTKRKSKGGTIKQELQKVYNKIPKEFHEPLEDLGRAGIEYAGYKLPPKKRTPVGKGMKKGDKSKTHKNDLDFTTKKGDMDFHRGGHDETSSESSSSSDSEDGTGVRRRKPRGMGMKKGSPEMKAHMAKLRAMKGKGKVSGTGIHGTGQVDNNSPHSGAVRLSPYQNF